MSIVFWFFFGGGRVILDVQTLQVFNFATSQTKQSPAVGETMRMLKKVVRLQQSRKNGRTEGSFE